MKALTTLYVTVMCKVSIHPQQVGLSYLAPPREPGEMITTSLSFVIYMTELLHQPIAFSVQVHLLHKITSIATTRLPTTIFTTSFFLQEYRLVLSSLQEVRNGPLPATAFTRPHRGYSQLLSLVRSTFH